MARLGSEGKGGFFPTPECEMSYLLEHITVNPLSQVSILDPCAGKGNALQQIKKHVEAQRATANTFAIEIEKSRAAEIIKEKRADQVLNCGYEETRISRNSISCLYLNPPFFELQGERAEKIFLNDLTVHDSLLSIGGLIILNVPQYVLPDIAKLISTRMEKVKVYRFSEENFSDYKQVFVLGYRRAAGLGRNENIEKYLIDTAYNDPRFIEAIDQANNEEKFLIPEQQKNMEIFKCVNVLLEDIQSADDSQFLSRIFSKVEDVQLQGHTKIRPAMHLKTTHLVQAIQSGALPEHMGDHLLVAKDEAVESLRIESDPDTGKEKHILTRKRKSVIRLFNHDGCINLK